MKKLGVIGFGHRIKSVSQYFNQEGLEIAAIADPRAEEIKKEFEGRNVAFYTDAETMLEHEALDGLVIGTRCSLHTPMALLAGKYNLPIFLEKPVSINKEQLEQLKSLLPISDRIVVSFPLRFCKIVQKVKQIIESGAIGSVEHVQAWNNVWYARGYYHKWYRDESETGGLFLQKTTHDFDYINYLLGENAPVRICAMKSKQVFKGDMPAGQKCADCPKAKECPESIQNIVTYGERSGNVDDGFLYCCFAKDTGNEDSGSAIVEYASGMHVAYSQDFIVRKDAGRRGARLIGYHGTVQFDFNTGLIEVIYHNNDLKETYQFPLGRGHSGGDLLLVRNFAAVVRGEERSNAPLTEGILSAHMCLAAKESAETHQFIDL